MSERLLPFRTLPCLDGGVPLLGHIPETRRDRLAFVQRITREARRVSRIRAGVVPAMVVNHPEPLHELLIERAHEFQKSYLLRFSLYPLAGEGLFTSHMDLWRRQRKLMASLFHPQMLERYAHDMIRCVARAAEGLRDGDDVSVHALTTDITMDVAGRTLFDSDTMADGNEIGRALTTALDWTSANAPSMLSVAHILLRVRLEQVAPLLPSALATRARALADSLHGPRWLPGESGRSLRAAVAVLDARVAEMIAARRATLALGAGDAPQDLLTRLLSAEDDDGTRMSDKQVRDEVLTLFVAGHETTATGLAWTLYLLARHPDVRAEVEREVDALGRDPGAADLPRLGLTSRVFKEALRLYPPVYVFARQAYVATELDGVEIAQHTAVMVCPYALHRHPDLWSQPEVFDPDRFLPEAEAKRSRLAWMPFGAGPRVCIGNQFALMEAALVLAYLLRRFRFDTREEEVPAPFATLRPSGPMRMRVTQRS
jgi:cytochrome P450